MHHKCRQVVWAGTYRPYPHSLNGRGGQKAGTGRAGSLDSVGSGAEVRQECRLRRRGKGKRWKR